MIYYPTIEVVYPMSVCKVPFDSKEKATEAYEILKGGWESYKKYRNDSTETVEIDTLNGKSTFKLETIQSISLNTEDVYEQDIRCALEREKLGRSIREELGLPKLKRDE